MLVAEDGAFDFTRVHSTLDQDSPVVLGRKIESPRKLARYAYFGDSHRRPEVRRLDEEGIVYFPFDCLAHLGRLAFPLAPKNKHPLDHRQSGVAEQSFHHILVHPGCGGQHARAHVRDSRQVEQSLDGAILTEGSVQYWKYNVKRRAG